MKFRVFLRQSNSQQKTVIFKYLIMDGSRYTVTKNFNGEKTQCAKNNNF